ncbi:MAG: hypothetical protein ACR2GT_07850 [Gaiellaceae bacterium]
MRVTPLYFVDPAPGSKYFQPISLNRFVAIHVELANVGTGLYLDTTSNGARVDAGGRLRRALIIDTAEPGLNRPRLQPGRSKTGTLSFEIPRAARVSSLRLTLDSDFGPETGVWTFSR